jgi:hypothetical protein
MKNKSTKQTCYLFYLFNNEKYEISLLLDDEFVEHIKKVSELDDEDFYNSIHVNLENHYLHSYNRKFDAFKKYIEKHINCHLCKPDIDLDKKSILSDEDNAKRPPVNDNYFAAIH